MRDRLWQWWPALPAALILYLGGSSFLEKYPHPIERRADRAQVTGGPDSLLVYVRGMRNGSLPAVSEDSSGAMENPFRPARAPHPGPLGQAARTDPPPRSYVLKGTVGSDVATIVNHSGQKQIVKVGDRIDSAEVISIEANKIVLKDRGGRFELLFQK